MIGYWFKESMQWVRGDMTIANAFEGASLTEEGFKPNIVEIHSNEFNGYSNEEVGEFIINTLIPALNDINGRLIITKG